MSKPETRCIRECYDPKRNIYRRHDPACPNAPKAEAPPAPKPEPHLHGCKAAGLLKGEPGYDRCTCPPAPVSGLDDRTHCICGISKKQHDEKKPWACDLFSPDMHPPVRVCACGFWSEKHPTAACSEYRPIAPAPVSEPPKLAFIPQRLVPAWDAMTAERDALKAQNATLAAEVGRLRNLIVRYGDRNLAARAAREAGKAPEADIIKAMIVRVREDEAKLADLLSALKQFDEPCDHGTLVTLEQSAMWCRFCMARAAIRKAEA